jgi:hypothetical protein
MIRMSFIVALVVSSQFVNAQNRIAYEFFSTLSDCTASLGGWKCLELDLSSEAEMQSDSTKTYKYSWTMGEGTRKEGNKIEHCYEQFGSYQVRMDLIDPEANTVIRNELSATVNLYPEIHPSIEVKTDDVLQSLLRFTCVYTNADNFEPDAIYWRIDGQYYEGKTVEHAFHLPGVYQIEMGIEKETDLIGTLTACVTKEITIRESDIWTTRIVSFMHEIQAKHSSGPFTRSDVFCLMTSRNTGETSIIPLNSLMRAQQVSKDSEYEILLFSGNSFTWKKIIKTHGLIGNTLYSMVKDTISSFVGEDLYVLPSLSLAQNSSTLANEIKTLADLLMANPVFSLQIGAYVHSGSRIEKGIASSLKNAELIKGLLVQNGVDARRISIASPENNKALMNTCSAVPDCKSEDKTLDGKVELKITGTTL